MKNKKFFEYVVIAIMIVSLINIVTADLEIKSFKNIGNNADLKLNLTLYSSESCSFNITLRDLTNENPNNRIIFSGTDSISVNETKTIMFGKIGSYDKELNNNWENYRCGGHNIEAKIVTSNGQTKTSTNSFEISGSTFDVRYTPDLNEKDIKASLSDNIEIKVLTEDGKAIGDANVEIKYEDTGEIKEKETNSKGITIFKPSYDFGRNAIGTYSIKIWKHEAISNHYYCDYKKQDIIIKKKLKIISITPENPKINEKITLRISTENEDFNYIYLWIEGNNKNPIYQTLSTSFYQFTLDSPGTYTVKIMKDENYWEDSKTIVISDFPELKIILPDDIVLDKENEFIITGANDVRISGVTVTLEDSEGIKKTAKTDYNGIVRWKLEKAGKYTITAEKENFKNASQTFFALKELQISISPEHPKIYDIVKIMLLDKNNNPVDGKIYIDKNLYTTTFGYITYNFTQFKEYEIKGEATGYHQIKTKIKPLKIINFEISNKNFSVGEDLIISLSGEGLTSENVNIEIKNIETNQSIYVHSLNPTFKLYFPGNYRITVSAPSFGTETKEIFVRYLPLFINATFENSKKEIKIKVTSENNPVSNVNITIITPGNLFAYILTDNNGIATFNKIYETGNYTIKAEKFSYTPAQTEIRVELFNFELILIGFLVIIIIVVLALFLLTKIKRQVHKENPSREHVQ